MIKHAAAQKKSPISNLHFPLLSNLYSHPLSPALLALLAMVLCAAVVILSEGGDPLALARLGTRFSQGDPNGTYGYDGQFTYYIARDPVPASVQPFLDVPAYRYQRILLPLVARLLSFRSAALIPWILALLGVFSQTAGTWVVSELLAGWGVSRWYALTYGLWAGFSLAVRLDLPEPLAFALAGGAILAAERGRPQIGWVLYSLALFAKEVAIVFVAAQLLADLARGRRRSALGLILVAVMPYALFQLWLWGVFGEMGLGSGGAMATPFEVIPFMGLLRIGSFSLPYLLAMLVVFGPSIVLPSIWAACYSVRKVFSNEINVVVLGLLLNAFLIAFLPFSTFRETGGLLRFACGLVLSVLLFAGRYRLLRVLNFSFFWLALDVFLLK